MCECTCCVLPSACCGAQEDIEVPHVCLMCVCALYTLVVSAIPRDAGGAGSTCPAGISPRPRTHTPCDSQCKSKLHISTHTRHTRAVLCKGARITQHACQGAVCCLRCRVIAATNALAGHKHLRHRANARHRRKRRLNGITIRTRIKLEHNHVLCACARQSALGFRAVRAICLGKHEHLHDSNERTTASTSTCTPHHTTVVSARASIRVATRTAAQAHTRRGRSGSTRTPQLAHPPCLRQSHDAQSRGHQQTCR